MGHEGGQTGTTFNKMAKPTSDIRVNDNVKIEGRTFARRTNIVQTIGTFKVFDVLTDVTEVSNSNYLSTLFSDAVQDVMIWSAPRGGYIFVLRHSVFLRISFLFNRDILSDASFRTVRVLVFCINLQL